MAWKPLNLCVKPGTLSFVGGHKVCRLEHKSAFSLWPCSHPLIIISRYKMIYSYCFIRVLCGLTVGRAWKCPEWSSSGYRLCLREEGSVSVPGDVVESVTHCHATLSCLTPAWLVPQFSDCSPHPRDVKDNGIFTALLCLRWNEASCLGLFLQT